jgi:hypothetical protein
MTQMTSVHIRPCNIGQSEAHNQRTKAYLDHINAEKLYIRKDLIPENQSWTSELQGDMTLRRYYDAIGRMVKEKTGRAMQTKERERINKKTGKVTKIAGCTPLREGVVVCKADTTMEQLRHFADLCRQRFGITAIQIHLHRDEGHCLDPNDNSTWKPNYHAHVIWDWMNHETGKSYKLDNEDISLMQDMAAEALEMERGVSRSETGKRHLERNDYIVAKQKRELEESKKQAEKLAKENEQKVLACEKLDKEIHDKQAKANRENGSAILSGLANLAGKGKYAQLESENMAMKQQVALLPEKIAQGVAERTAELEKACERERRIAELRLNEYNKLTQSYNRLLKKSQSDKKSYETALSQKDCIIANLISAFQKAIDLLDVVCRKAMKAVIDFAKKPIARRFTYEQACAVNEFLDTGSDRREAADTLITLSRPFLTENEYTKGRQEVQNVENDFPAYQRMLQRQEERIASPRHGRRL